MLDIKFVRENPDAVRENIKKKFQDEKLPLVDEVLELDRQNRAAITEASDLRAARNSLSKQVGMTYMWKGYDYSTEASPILNVRCVYSKLAVTA